MRLRSAILTWAGCAALSFGVAAACSLAAPVSIRAQILSLGDILSGLVAPEGVLPPTGPAPVPVQAWRSPSASPTADPAGWLGRDDLPTAAWTYAPGILYRTERGGRPRSQLEGGHRLLAASPSIGPDGWHLLWGTLSASERSDGPLPRDRGLYRRSADNTRWWGGLRAGGVKWRAMATAGFRREDRRHTEGMLAAHWEPGPGFSASVWGAREGSEDRIGLSYRDESASLAARDLTERLGALLRALYAGWSVTARVERLNGRADPPDTDDHRLRPGSALRLVETAVGIPGGGIILVGGLSTASWDADTDFLRLRYGRFHIEDERWWVRLGQRPGLVPASHESWIGYSRTRLNGEANVGLWPFTTTVVDILGPRRFALAFGDVDLITAGSRWAVETHRTRLLVGLDLHHALTDGGTVSWEPQILGFGRRNVLRDRIELERSVLVDLGLDVALSLSSPVTLRIGASQIAPIWTRRRGGGGGGGGTSGGTSAQETLLEWGGLRAWIGLELRPPLP